MSSEIYLSLVALAQKSVELRTFARGPVSGRLPRRPAAPRPPADI